MPKKGKGGKKGKKGKGGKKSGPPPLPEPTVLPWHAQDVP
eukprot:COSAG05_NODE_18205_length_312_cov_0.718310_1_plen_39_part_01